MKRLLLILILTLSFQSWTKADDIKDFEIEGISIGDSLLDYFSEEEIDNNNLDLKTDLKFQRILILNTKNILSEKYRSIKTELETYDGMHIYIKSNDNNYIIHGIEGMLNFENDISGCRIKQNKILNNVSELFKNEKKKSRTFNHSEDKTGKSKVYRTSIKISPEGKYYELDIACYDWSEKMGHIDHFRISIVTDSVNDMF